MPVETSPHPAIATTPPHTEAEESELENELSSAEMHAYVVCNFCWGKQKPGVLVDTLCGLLVRVRRVDRPTCRECVSIREKVSPNMVPCTFCGFKCI